MLAWHIIAKQTGSDAVECRQITLAIRYQFIKFSQSERFMYLSEKLLMFLFVQLHVCLLLCLPKWHYVIISTRWTLKHFIIILAMHNKHVITCTHKVLKCSMSSAGHNHSI